MDDSDNQFVTAEVALEIILSAVREKGNETVRLSEAYGRVLYDDVRADADVPPLDNSAMDGFALRFEETAEACRDRPVRFRIVGEIRAGEMNADMEVLPHTAIRIMTGAPVPQGANAVIPVEKTEIDERNTEIFVFQQLKKHENIRFAGEDIRVGESVLQKGTRLGSADLGMLAAVNRETVVVYARPRVAIISTGDEIVEVGEELGYGQIRNSNAYTLQAEVMRYNGIATYLGIAHDEPRVTKEIFERGLEHDIVISTGGVSLGEYDFVKNVLEELGVTIAIGSIRMKPGKPTTFGTTDDTLFFGLPGNPVSTMVSFVEFVRPAILKMSGASKLKKPEIPAIAENDIGTRPGRKEYIRGNYFIKNNQIYVTTTGPQGSGILRSMSQADCLILLPEESAGVRAGEHVMIQLIHHREIM